MTNVSRLSVFGRHLTACRFSSHLGTRQQSTGTENLEFTSVAIPEIKQFIQRCMEKVGTRPAHATALADNLAGADYRGHFSHGLNRLDMYVRDLKAGITVSDRDLPETVKENAATAHVDGCNLLGPVVGNYCMDIAMQKAKTAGVGWVVAKGSNHFGFAGGYCLRALDQGLMGMAFTNTSPLVLPTRGRKVCLGTNPISLSAPGHDGDSYVLDMATSAVALGKIELNRVRGVPIPLGWGADESGTVSSDPGAVADKGGLLPLGGTEVNSGYKGYGLAMLVEIFCGILGGATYGPNIRRWKTTDRIADVGQCFIAIDPSSFAPGFEGRMQDLMNTLRGQDPAEGETQVLVPGDKSRMHMAKCDKMGGIPYHPNQVDNLNRLAAEIDVRPMQPLS